jgi:hypothetical protein
MVKGLSMFPGNPNPFLQPPGKISKDTQRLQTQSGQLVELRTVEMTVLENGTCRKERVFEVVPPLADNRIPDKIADVRECCVCLRLFHKDNVSRCPICGGDYCAGKDCRGEVKVSKEEKAIVCAPCAQKANTTLFERIAQKLWKLEV